MQRVDVVVIGAGAMGSATAWSLARRGRSVLLVEQFEPGHTRGSSHAEVRVFRQAYADPYYVSLARRALADWRDLESASGETLLDLSGAYDHGPAEAIAPFEAAMRAGGATVELLRPQEAADRVPGMRFDEHVLFHAQAGRVFAARTLRALQRCSAELGATISHNTPAEWSLAGDGVDVRLGGSGPLADTMVHADVAVLTAGAWIAPVAGQTFALPRLELGEEHVVHFTPHDPNVVFPSFIHRLNPFHYGLHTPGVGLKVGGEHERPVRNADDRDPEMPSGWVAEAAAYARRWLPGVDPTPHIGPACLFTTTPNDDFILDRVGPIVIGSPCSGHGFKFTPLIGRLLADLACGDPAADDPGVLAPRHRLVAFA
jgi:sarcosine oxidase